MAKVKSAPASASASASTTTVLRDLGKATEKTRSNGPPERYDNVVLHTKGPYLG